MITEFVIPTDVNFAKRHEPTGAAVGRRATGADDPREVSKADQSKPSAGRQVTGTLFGMNHSLIAGRKGKKLKAAGTSLGYGTAGTIAGAVAGGGAGALLHEPALSGIAARVGSVTGGFTGQHHAVMRNQAAGRYKAQVSKAQDKPKFGANRDFTKQPPTRGEKALAVGALATLPASGYAGYKGNQALMRRSYRRRAAREGPEGGGFGPHDLLHPPTESLARLVSKSGGWEVADGIARRGVEREHAIQEGGRRRLAAQAKRSRRHVAAAGVGGGALGMLAGRATGRPVSKGLLTPTNPGPVKAAPTIANKGPQPPKKGLLIRTAQLADDPIRMAAQMVTKAVSEKRRMQLAHKGKAFSNGSWPIGNAADARHAQWDLNRMKGKISGSKRAEIESRIHAVTKADARDRRRGAAKGAAAGAGVMAAGGAVLGNSYHNHTKERRVARGQHPTRAGDVVGAARSMFRPSVIRDLHGLTVMPAVAGAGIGAAAARSRRRQPVAKAYRSFDPEDARQRRLGAMAAGTGLGGGTLVASGGRQIRRDSRSLGEHVRGARETVEVDNRRRSLLRGISELPDKKVALVRARPAGKVAGGAALLAGAGALMSDRHKKPWR